jgi:hypothetical protein
MAMNLSRHFERYDDALPAGGDAGKIIMKTKSKTKSPPEKTIPVTRGIIPASRADRLFPVVTLHRRPVAADRKMAGRPLQPV